MEQFSLVEFLTMSIPEEFLLCFFVWTILGKKDTVKFRMVLATTLITAIAFVGFQFFSNWELALTGILNLLVFTVIIFFTYKLSAFESIISSLLSMVISTLIQFVVMNVSVLITNNKLNTIEGLPYKTRLLLFIPTFILYCLLSLIIYKLNIKVLNFKSKKTNAYYLNRIRFIVLQLTFTFIIILFNIRLYWNNKLLFNSFNDKVLVFMNLTLIAVFTILIVISVFRLGKGIQMEEEQKRSFDNREFLQNIDYLSKLMEMKDYLEAEKILEYIKNDISSGMLNNQGSNRENSIK